MKNLLRVASLIALGVVCMGNDGEGCRAAVPMPYSCRCDYTSDDPPTKIIFATSQEEANRKMHEEYPGERCSIASCQ